MNVLIGIYVLGITIPIFTLFFKNYKYIPAVQKEENLASREFWMFIGSMLLLLSAIFIISVTSLPVYNKILGTNLADPPDPQFVYNKVLVLVIILIGLMTGFGQFLKYRNTSKKYFTKNMLWPAIAAVVISVLLAIVYPFTYESKGPGFLLAIYLAFFACIFSVIANATYVFKILKGNMKSAGSAIAHFGFTLMIAGMLVSASNKKTISDNSRTGLMLPASQDPSGRGMDNPMENLTLIKGVPTEMGKYIVTYYADSTSPSEKTRTYYKLHFQSIDSADKHKESFVLAPDSYRMKDNNLTSNPSTKHYLTHDIFTYVSTISVPESKPDTASFQTKEMKIGDTTFYSHGYIVLNGIEKNPDNERFHFAPDDTALVADLTAFSDKGTSYKLFPGLKVRNMSIQLMDDTSVTQNLFVRFSGIAQGNNKFRIGIKENDALTNFIAVKTYIFPYINLVWAGLIIMAGGLLVSLLHRSNASKKLATLSMILVFGALIFLFLFAQA